jgi:hypothetical protein
VSASTRIPKEVPEVVPEPVSDTQAPSAGVLLSIRTDDWEFPPGALTEALHLTVDLPESQHTLQMTLTISAAAHTSRFVVGRCSL